MLIVTDSAADMPLEEIREFGITVAPLQIQFPEGSVRSEDMTPDEFYNRLDELWPVIPSTSQPSSGAFRDLYQKLAEMKEEILSIHISSGLSGTIESARLGAEQAPQAKVHPVDTLTLSGGERFQVLAAAMGARAGWSVDVILDRLHKIQQATELIFTLETLAYLAKGGRIGRVQAMAGSLLKLKPLIHVDKTDGKYNTAGKVRTLPRALEGIRDFLAKQYGDEPVWVAVMHGRFAEQAKRLSDLLKEQMNVSRLEILRVSPVLGVHTGPGVVGAAVVPARLMEDFE